MGEKLATQPIIYRRNEGCWRRFASSLRCKVASWLPSGMSCDCQEIKLVFIKGI